MVYLAIVLAVLAILLNAVTYMPLSRVVRGIYDEEAALLTETRKNRELIKLLLGQPAKKIEEKNTIYEVLYEDEDKYYYDPGYGQPLAYVPKQEAKLVRETQETQVENYAATKLLRIAEELGNPDPSVSDGEIIDNIVKILREKEV